MWTALALFGTPLLCLAHLGIAYALVMPACAQQSALWLHAVGATCTALCAICALGARGGLRASQPLLPAAASMASPFLRAMAWPAGALFTLVTAAQWLAVWVLSPCAT